MTSVLDALRQLTAAPKRHLTDLRRNIQPGDEVLWNGSKHVVADVRVAVYSGKDVLLKCGKWVPVVEVWGASDRG